MIETIQEYQERITGYVVGQDVLALQRAMPDTLENIVHRVEPAQLSVRPSPTKWSVQEIVAHLADDELVGAYRIRLILSSPGTAIQSFDQDLWASIGSYNALPIGQSLELFRLLRKANLSLFKALTPDQWQLYGVHAERGRESIQDIATYYAGHDMNHLHQIESILSLQPKGRFTLGV